MATGASALCGARPVAGLAAPQPAAASPAASFRYCLNTATIRGQNLPLPTAIDVAADAGYEAIEPWIDEIRRFEEGGGKLSDIATRCRDRGLEVASAIGFAPWIVDDPAGRAEGLEQARRDMDAVRRIGGSRIAAPPAGAAAGAAPIPLAAIAERYAQLLEVGAAIGVVPQVEVWGFAGNLSQLADAAYVATAAGHSRACVLADVYHLYKGGSDFDGLALLAPAAMPCFHVNDYPAQPPRGEIADEHRLFPGDGVAPLDAILRTLAARGAAPCVLSLELFHREYWQQDPAAVARQGLEKMRAAVARAAARPD